MDTQSIVHPMLYDDFVLKNIYGMLFEDETECWSCFRWVKRQAVAKNGRVHDRERGRERERERERENWNKLLFELLNSFFHYYLAWLDVCCYLFVRQHPSSMYRTPHISVCSTRTKVFGGKNKRGRMILVLTKKK